MHATTTYTQQLHAKIKIMLTFFWQWRWWILWICSTKLLIQKLQLPVWNTSYIHFKGSIMKDIDNLWLLPHNNNLPCSNLPKVTLDHAQFVLYSPYSQQFASWDYLVPWKVISVCANCQNANQGKTCTGSIKATNCRSNIIITNILSKPTLQRAIPPDCFLSITFKWVTSIPELADRLHNSKFCEW